MYKEPWFKFLVWSNTIFFFFVFTFVTACLLAPPPSDEQIQKWMLGMHNAMKTSLMGIAMHSRNNEIVSLENSVVQLVPLYALLGLSFGLITRIWRGKK